MKIIYKSIDELIPYENNARKNKEAVEYVAKSIKEFGFKVPIIIDRQNVIVAGHTRLKAAESLCIQSVPCVVADDLTEDQVRAFRLADNKVAGFSTWNFRKLSTELDSLEDFEMEQFGFDTFDFDEIEKMEKYPETKVVTCPKCGTVFEVEV